MGCFYIKMNKMSKDTRFDFKKLFNSLKIESEIYYNKRISGLSDKTKRSIDKYLFNHDVNGLQCSKNRYLDTKGMIQNIEDYFKERNLIIERLTRPFH